MYQQMKEKYGDDRIWDRISGRDMAFVESIVDIDISSVPEWNDDYTPQSSLDDIFEVEYATYKYYVESGFDPEFKGDLWGYTWYETRIERKRVSELEEDDMWFIYTDFRLICTTPPNTDRVRTLKIKLLLDTGEEQTFRVRVE